MVGPWVLALRTPGLFDPAPTLTGSMGTDHSQTLHQSQEGKALIGSNKGLKRPSLNLALQAGKEPGTSQCMPWGAQGGVRHLGELRLGEHPRWGFGFFVTLEAPATPGALAISFGAVGQWVNAKARGWCVCRLAGIWVPPLAAHGLGTGARSPGAVVLSRCPWCLLLICR